MKCQLMLESMTGYGRAVHVCDDGAVTVEMKSVNHRYLDVSFRMPREFAQVEEAARALVSERLSRGRVDVSVSVEWRSSLRRTVVFDTHLARVYAEGLASLAADLSVSGAVTAEALARYPDVITVQESGADPETLWAMFRPALEEALNQLVAMRRAEGQRLESDIVHRVRKIEQTLVEIVKHAPDSVEAYRTRLARRVAEMLGDARVDEARLATEVALFADRCDYTEEAVRFRSHIEQFCRTLSEGGARGKKLDFITQEMNRESNTIASKAQQSLVSAHVVEIKSELEKVREQVQNVE